MKKKKIVAALFVLSGLLVTNLAFVQNYLTSVKAENGNNNYNENPLLQDEIEEEVLDFKTDGFEIHGGKDSKDDDKSTIRKILKTDDVEYEGEVFSPILDENNELAVGESEKESKKLTWTWFNAKSYKLFDAIVMYASPVRKDILSSESGEINVSNDLEAFSFGIEKGTTIGASLEENLKVGAGFGGFCKAGIELKMSQEIEEDTTFHIDLQYYINENIKDGNTGLVYEYAKYTMKFLVFKFTHTWTECGWWVLNNPLAILNPVPRFEVVNVTAYSTIKIVRN